MPPDEAATAHHEAGHAVAAVTFRRSLTQVSVEPDGHSLGRMAKRPQAFCVPQHGEVPASVRRAVNADIVVAWAGPLAEERVVGSYNHVNAEHDLDRMWGTRRRRWPTSSGSGGGRSGCCTNRGSGPRWRRSPLRSSSTGP